MLIHDTVTDFTESYLPTIDYLKKYYEKYVDHFEEYFRYHCHHVDKKMKKSGYSKASGKDISAN